MVGSSSFKTLLSIQALAGACAASSTLLRGGTIIGWDSSSGTVQITRNGTLLIKDDRVTAIYAEHEEPSDLVAGDGDNDAAEVVDVTGSIITPGFIDTHAHRWQTGFRTLGHNTTLWEYFNRYSPLAVEGLLDAEDVYIGQIMGLLQAVDAGTTTTLDHAHHIWSPDTALAGAQGSIDSGARVFWSYALSGVQGFSLEEQFEDFEKLAESGIFNGTSTSLGIAFDAFGANPVPENTERVKELAFKHQVPVITTHVVGSVWGFTNTPSSVHAAGLLDTDIPVVFSHGSNLDIVDYKLLKETNQHVAITPESDMHYAMPLSTTHLYMDQGSLGIDTHFTFSIDLLGQARLWLQHIRSLLFAQTTSQWKVPANTPMSVQQAFLLATRNGGQALRRDDLGVIAPGAKADLVVWDGTGQGMLGWDDPLVAVMMHANVGDIQHVLVDGKFKKRDGKLVQEDLEDLRERFVRSAKKLQATLREIPFPVPQGTWEVTGAELGEVPIVDVVRGDGTGYGQ